MFIIPALASFCHLFIFFSFRFAWYRDIVSGCRTLVVQINQTDFSILFASVFGVAWVYYEFGCCDDGCGCTKPTRHTWIYVLVLNHVHRKNVRLYHIVGRINQRRQSTWSKIEQFFFYTNKNNWMKSRKIDLCACWKLKGNCWDFDRNGALRSSRWTCKNLSALFVRIHFYFCACSFRLNFFFFLSKSWLVVIPFEVSRPFFVYNIWCNQK